MPNIIGFNGTKTPAKVHIPGLLSLSSSNKKRNLTKYLRNTRKTVINIELDYGFIRPESLSKFVVNVFQYLLYDKEVIPIPFQYYDRIYLSNSPLNDCWLKNKDLLTDMFTKLNGIFSYTIKLFFESTIYPKCIAMCFGDSIRLAKEIFILELSNLNWTINDNDNETTYKNGQMPLLSLNSLINKFYNKLLNEASEKSSSVLESKTKHKAINVFFAIEIDSKDTTKFEKFVSAQTDIDIQTHFEYLSHLGCTITKTTSFSIHHESAHFNSDFEIHTDGCAIEEIIEEVLIEEDENDLNKNLCENQLDGSVNSSSSTLDETKDDLYDLPEKKSNDLIWVQIGKPVRCINKLRK